MGNFDICIGTINGCKIYIRAIQTFIERRKIHEHNMITYQLRSSISLSLYFIAVCIFRDTPMYTELRY